MNHNGAMFLKTLNQKKKKIFIIICAVHICGF